MFYTKNYFNKACFFFTLITFSLKLFALDATIVSFFPQGENPVIRQVKAVFSEEMVPLGHLPNLLPPFKIECTPHSQEKGQARWIDSKTFVYDFAEELAGGTSCQFTLRLNTQTLSHKTIKTTQGNNQFNFNTGDPKIIFIRPWDGEQNIHENQSFLLFLNGPINLTTLKRKTYFTVEGLEEKIGVTFLSGSIKEQMIKTVYLDPEIAKKSSVALKAKQTFPFQKKVSLTWGQETFSFQTRAPFTLKLSCDKTNTDSLCNPLTPLSVRFSSEVPWSTAKKIQLIGPTQKIWKGEDYPPSSNLRDQDEVTYLQFPAPLLSQSELALKLPANFKDSEGRELVDPGILTFQLGKVPPLAKFPAPFGILEWTSSGAVLPLTVRDIEASAKFKLMTLSMEKIGTRTQRIPTIISWLQVFNRYQQQGKNNIPLSLPNLNLHPHLQTPRIQLLTLPKQSGQGSEVVGLPILQPGFFLAEVESQILAQTYQAKSADSSPSHSSYYTSTSGIATNMAVHYKEGDKNSLIWVTELSSGNPVPKATVSLWNCRGEKIWQGITNREGVAVVNREKSSSPPTCLPEAAKKELYSYPLTYETQTFVFAEKGSDISFTHTSWNEGLENWRFSLPSYWPSPDLIRHTVLDRPLYRPGEKVSMKHFLRAQGLRGPHIPQKISWPNSLEIVHMGDGQKYTFPLQWRTQGLADSEWTIPKEAKLGLYYVYLKSTKKQPGKNPGQNMSYEDSNDIPTGEFSVEEFRVPLSKASLKIPDTPPVGPQKIPLLFWVEYLNGGGGASHLSVKLRIKRTILDGAPAPTSLYNDYNFFHGPIPQPKSSDETKKEKLETLERTLDDNGYLQFDIPGISSASHPYDFPEQVEIEAEYRDPNGEIKTYTRSFITYPHPWVLGLKVDTGSPLSSPQKILKAAIKAVNLQGIPLSGTKVTINLYKRIYYSYRKKIAGGFYSYENFEEVKPQGKLCEGVTDSLGELHCSRELQGKKDSGDFYAEATLHTPEGKFIQTYQPYWFYGDDQEWSSGRDHDRMDLSATKKEYDPGETIPLRVHLPFAKASVLLTIEREGVLDYSVHQLTRENPFIAVPVKEDYSPNIFLSTLAVRGRSEGPRPTGLVDLARPAHKLGIIPMKIGLKNHRLQVQVTPHYKGTQESYQIRDKAKVSFLVSRENGKPLPAGGELAVAVVDEGLLQLKENESWKLLEKMLNPRDLKVQTYTGQMYVVGKRHFGLKAVPAGGGGGMLSSRELFDTLLLWKGKVPLVKDKTGKNAKAELEIPLNDSLTSFKIVALASAGEALFGTGSKSIRTTKDLLVFSGLPLLTRHGDKWQGEFTFKNTLSHPLDLEVELTGIPSVSFPPQKLQLAPQQGKTLSWNITIPEKISQMTYQLITKNKNPGQGEGQDQILDKLLIKQKVIPSQRIRPITGLLRQVEQVGQDKKLEIPLEREKQAENSFVKIELQPQLNQDLSGIKDFMTQYPYTCLEQQVSKAVSLQDHSLWNKIMKQLPQYISDEGLLAPFPSQGYSSLKGSPNLTSYVLTMAYESKHPWPDESLRKRLIEGLQNFVLGKIKNFSDSYTFTDVNLRKLEAVATLAQYGEARKEMLDPITIEPTKWSVSSVLDWWKLLLLLNDQDLKNQYLQQAENLVKTKFFHSGGVVTLSDNSSAYPWWAMASADSETLRLISLLIDFYPRSSDIPLLLRGAVQRLRQGHWDLTTANAWGVLTLKKYSEKFENEKVQGTTTLEISSPNNSSPSVKENFSWQKNHSQPYQYQVPLPEPQSTLKISHQGSGRPWVALQTYSDIPLKAPLFQGFRLQKKLTTTVTSTDRKTDKKWSQGEVIDVEIELTSLQDMSYVVVEDPIPTGATILGRFSPVDESDKILTPLFVENGMESRRVYFDFVPRGTWKIRYSFRPNSKGIFVLPPLRAQAMYLPEVMGELPYEDGGLFEVH